MTFYNIYTTSFDLKALNFKNLEFNVQPFKIKHLHLQVIENRKRQIKCLGMANSALERYNLVRPGRQTTEEDEWKRRTELHLNKCKFKITDGLDFNI